MTPVPATTNFGRVALARSYVGGMTGASAWQMERFSQRGDLKAAVASRPGPCPLNIPVTG
ncbi:hypothetical protein GCM10022419_106450 [Nonomuraea rosea]|uniref:Uncharacterized protein n=1 Tax=Nonomuraea rosea TaxID=638574 RepID=A0ABP6ZBG3_9ACTN